MTERESRLTGYRRRRDQFFAEHAHSPLTAEQRSRFKGLNYFPEREDLALNLPLDESGEHVGEELELTTTDAQAKPFVRAGTVEFTVDDQQVRLSVLRDGQHGGLFLPFRDSLADSETYGVGRYLEPQMRPDGTLDIDFNYAYNPFCAYGDSWSCPKPPSENTIAVEIRAGERAFQLPEDDD